MKFVFKDFPLESMHPQAFTAAVAAHCAGEQGKFWEYHDRLFANQQAMMPNDLRKHAADLGLEATRFNACLDENRYANDVRADMQEGMKAGVASTPTVFVNGRAISGAQPYEVFEAMINEELERASRGGR